jgi:uncharacterized repeat protein (TIGR01451 family)
VRLEHGDSWNVAIPFSTVLVFLGLLTSNTAFFVAAGIPVILVIYSELSRVPGTEEVKVTREITNEAPNPGETVEVEVTVENTGRRTLADLRVVDGVPEELKVESGSPRASTSLTPGSSDTYSYTITARRGKFLFEDARVENRSLASRSSEVGERTVSGDQIIECKVEVGELPLRDETIERVGEMTTDTGGPGIEFHSLREYHRGDPPSRVEWSHLAKTGRLSTVNFKEQKSTKIVLAVDARQVSNRKSAHGHPSGIDLSTYAAERAFGAIQRSMHVPGALVLGVDPKQAKYDSVLLPYIKPGKGVETRKKTEKLFEQARKLEKEDVEDIATKIYSTVPGNAQIMVFSPLLDDRIVESLRILDSHGYSITVLSPDVTYGDDPANVLESVKREFRLKEVRKIAPVVTWNADTPLTVKISEALKQMSGGNRR